MSWYTTLFPILIAAGEIDRVIGIGERAAALSKERGESWCRGYRLDYLARARWLRGDRERAETLAPRGGDVQARGGRPQQPDHGARDLASVAAERGAHERAAILLGLAQRVRDLSSITLIELHRQQHERSVSIILQGIGRKALDAAYARGRAMTIDEGVALAVQDKQPPTPTPEVRTEPDSGLTRRQLDIARLVADDLTNRQIAARLFLSERTVETHVTNILNKLGLGSRVQLARWMAEQAGPGPAAATGRRR